MKKFWFQIIGLVLLISVATFLAFNSEYIRPFISQVAKNPRSVPNPSAAATAQKLQILDSGNNPKVEINIEIANTPEVRTKGLGYRQSLATDSGMLFSHDKLQKYTYWMKGMQFPIDIMWIKDDTIVDIIPNIPPPIPGQTDDTLERYSSTVEVNKVLETNSGFVNQFGIQKGDRIKIQSSR